MLPVGWLVFTDMTIYTSRCLSNSKFFNTFIILPVHIQYFSLYIVLSIFSSQFSFTRIVSIQRFNILFFVQSIPLFYYIFRDLSARNCLVMSNHTLKIGDYGIADDLYKVRKFIILLMYKLLRQAKYMEVISFLLIWFHFC